MPTFTPVTPTALKTIIQQQTFLANSPEELDGLVNAFLTTLSSNGDYSYSANPLPLITLNGEKFVQTVVYSYPAKLEEV